MAQQTVLVVEDEVPIAQILTRLLSFEGFQPLLARTAEEAELLLRREPVDLVLTDLWTLTYDERIWEPIARLRTLVGNLPIIVCTAHGQAIHEDPEARGVSDIVIKPFDLDDLAWRIRRALATPTPFSAPAPNLTRQMRH